VKSIDEGAMPSVRCRIGNTGKFEIRVGMHQESCLSALLFILVMDAILEHKRREVPWDMLYAYDLIVADKKEAGIQTRFIDWQRALHGVQGI